MFQARCPRERRRARCRWIRVLDSMCVERSRRSGRRECSYHSPDSSWGGLLFGGSGEVAGVRVPIGMGRQGGSRKRWDWKGRRDCVSPRGRESRWAWGILRPRILPPEAANELDAKDREMLPLHELSHVAAGDALALTTGQVAVAAHWRDECRGSRGPSWHQQRSPGSEREVNFCFPPMATLHAGRDGCTWERLLSALTEWRLGRASKLGHDEILSNGIEGPK